MACIALLVLGVGCRSGVAVSHEKDALLNADRAWAQMVSAGGNADSILSFWSEDAHVAMPNAPLFSGKAAVRQMVASSVRVPGFHIMWTPEMAVVAASGDLGYTTGTNEVRAPDATGKLTTTLGRYLTVWRRESDGRWRCVEDYSTPGPVDARPRA